MRMRKSLLILFLVPIFSLDAAGEVDLLWQGETYTPPFYDGRTLWSNETRVKVVAVSNISGFDPSTLYYRWTKDGIVLGSLSGVGKSSMVFVDSVLSLPIEVKVDLRDGEDGKVLGTQTVVLTPGNPRTIVVEKSPLYGYLFNKAVGSEFELKSEEVSFAAYPLFGQVTYKDAPALTYKWITNTGDTRTGSEVIYRVPEGASGSSSVNLKVTHSRVLVQPRDKSFVVRFDNNQSGF